MHIKEKKFLYFKEDQIFNFTEELHNGIQIKLFVGFETEKFMDYQKDLIQDFMADFIDKINDKEYTVDIVKTSFEIGLQNLNMKLKAFADKVRDVEYFDIKGYAQIIVDNVLMSSMIGDASIMIFRNEKLYYSLHNGVDNKGKIDLFSDFVEGDVENEDQIIYVGTKISDVLDNHDFKEMESVLKSENIHLINFVQELLAARLDKKNIGFIKYYQITGTSTRVVESMPRKFDNNGFFALFRNKFLKNKYQATVAILGIFILFMLINLLSGILRSNTNTVVMSDGVSVDLTMDDIKKDIFMFQSMDPTSDEKSIKYHEILEKLDILESKGKWLEDVTQLKKVLQADYYKGFNIVYISNLTKLDDPTSLKKSKIFTFNSTERSKLGAIKGMYSWKNLIIAGAKSALVGIMDDNIRGNFVDYNLQDDEVKGCNFNLLKDGLYCFTNDNNIISVNKAGSQAVTTSDPDGFVKNIAGLVTYGKANLYVFQPNLSSVGNNILVTRYRNTLGSQTIYQGGQNYSLAPNLTGVSIGGTGFYSFAIDGSFLARSNGKLYQFRRDPPASSTLIYREIKLLGGDKVTNVYGSEVKIISSINSKYVYLFDKINQTFTIYESRPAKNADQYSANYGLYYLFRFKFDLGANNVLDIEIPDPTGDRPEMYVLTNDGINKVSLYDFIDSIKANKVVKQISQ